MFDLIAKYWWTFVVRGLLAIVFGLIALVWPEIRLMVLVVLFGIYVIINPGAGALAAVWLIGIYALMFGGLLTLLGLKFRKLQRAQ